MEEVFKKFEALLREAGPYITDGFEHLVRYEWAVALTCCFIGFSFLIVSIFTIRMFLKGLKGKNDDYAIVGAFSSVFLLVFGFGFFGSNLPKVIEPKGAVIHRIISGGK